MLTSSCYSYKRAIIDPDLMLIGKHYKLTFEDGTVKRFKFKAEKDSLKMPSLFFGKIEKIAITDAIEIKEGKFSIVKTTLVSSVAVLIMGLVVAVLNYSIGIGDNFQLQ
jgi:hypothetical protein